MIYRPLNSNSYTEGNATATVLITGNEPPRAKFDDPAIEDRTAVLEKKRSFLMSEAVSTLSYDVRTEYEKVKFLHWLWCHPEGVLYAPPMKTESMLAAQKRFTAEAREVVDTFIAEDALLHVNHEDEDRRCKPDDIITSNLIWFACVLKFVPANKRPDGIVNVKSFNSGGQTYKKTKISRIVSHIVNSNSDVTPMHCIFTDKKTRFWKGAKLDDNLRAEVDDALDEDEDKRHGAFE